MKAVLANKLQGFKNTLGLTDQAEFEPVWLNQEPLAFTKELADARTAMEGLGTEATRQSENISGSTRMRCGPCARPSRRSFTSWRGMP